MGEIEQDRFGLGRRAFIGGAIGAATGVVLVRNGLGVGIAGASDHLGGEPFTLGVASGDPLPDRVVLWTRLAPDPLAGGGMPAADVDVTWEVAEDPAFGTLVASGTDVARAEHAHSVHVDPTGLAADTWYWYRFRAEGYTSPVGRTRTAPANDCTVETLRFGFATCQSWTSGFYPAYAHLAEEACDVVLFLGDYIYEGGVGGASAVRPHNSGEVVTLDEYRNRYALYKGDANLQAAHAACPWIVTWDDHEVDNDYAGDQDQDGGSPEDFLVRRAAAYQAWWEHQPVRLAPPTGPDLQIYRSFAWGDLASLVVLDGRQYRSTQVCEVGPGPVYPTCADRDDLTRSMLGSAQEAWLGTSLRGSGSTWNVVANQTVFSAMPLFGLFNMDQWDGYPGAQARLRDLLAEPEVLNPIVITGDIHAAGVATIPADWADPASPVIGTELVTTSISSSFASGDLAQLAQDAIGELPYVEYIEVFRRGYTVVDLDHTRMLATFRVVESALVPTSPIDTAFEYEVAAVGVAECEPPPVDPPPTDPPATDPPVTDPPTTVPATTTPATTTPAAAAQPAAATRAAPRFTG